MKKVALPGYSEHHTGLAIDFTTPEEDGLVTEAFEQTKAFRWLKKTLKYWAFQ
ncbi:D-alanyl-D-alanine carboxypeptidase family protein [Francisellaceae bacterium CB52]